MESKANLELIKKVREKLETDYQGELRGQELVSLCPFHKEKTPSFNFHISKGIFRCFGCSAKGNITILAKQLDIPIPEKTTAKEINNKKDPKDLAENYYKDLLKSDISYWTNRGIVKESLDQARIGVLKENKLTYDIFPYYDKENKFIAFKKLPKEKELRKQYTRWIPAKKGSPLYGLQFLNKYDTEKPLLLCEGEKDYWILKQAGYQVFGIPAAQAYKKSNNKLLKDFGYIYILLDNDKAGKDGSLTTLKNLGRGYLCKWEMLNGVSEKITDVNDLYLLEPKKFNEQIDKLIHNATEPLNTEAASQEINNRKENYEQVDIIRINPQMSAHQKKRSIAEYIFDQLIRRGNWYYTEALNFYYFEGKEKEVYDLNGQYWEFFLHSQFGINKAGTEFDFIQNELKSAAIDNGSKTEIQKTRFYNKITNSLYIFDNQNGIYKITEDNISYENNGIDGVLFLKDPMNMPINVDLNKELSTEERARLIQIITKNPNYSKDSPLSPAEAETTFGLWIYSLFFAEKFPEKPILCLNGEKGSAKSFSLKLVRYLFYGNEKKETRDLPDTEDKADNFIINNYLSFLDNVDQSLKGKKSWVPDWLATRSTGTEITSRKLYTNNESISIIPKFFLAITSRTPHFRRDDIADRLLLIHLDRYEKEDRKLDTNLYNTLETNRNDIWLAIFSELQNILKAVQQAYNGVLNFRITGFAYFCLQIAQYNKQLKTMQTIFDKLSRSQTDFTLENESIFTCLETWIDQNHQNGGLAPTENNGREMLINDLYDELEEISISLKEDKKFPKTVKSFSQKLRNIKSNLSAYFEINTRKGKARTSYLTFSKKEL